MHPLQPVLMSWDTMMLAVRGVAWVTRAGLPEQGYQAGGCGLQHPNSMFCLCHHGSLAPERRR